MPNDFAEYARNILRKQSKVKTAPPKATVDAKTEAAPAAAPMPAPPKQFYHPEVYKHVSMHIADRLKKLGA